VFPQQIADYFLKYNQGQLDNMVFPFDDGYALIHCFYELDQPSEIYEKTIELSMTNEYWPSHLVPFAYDQGGYDFCFSRREEDIGAIFLHQDEYVGEERECLFLAPDFNTFLNSLKNKEGIE
jgi:hypothetical protein